MPEERVTALQATFDGRAAAIAILPDTARRRLAHCGLPLS
jgi:hypothetical protein